MAGRGRMKGDGMGKFGGRKAGTPNKVTKAQREAISAFIDNKWQAFEEAFDTLDPSTKCHVVLGLLPFAVPKLASIEYKDKDKPKTFMDELDEISGEITRK